MATRVILAICTHIKHCISKCETFLPQLSTQSQLKVLAAATSELKWSWISILNYRQNGMVYSEC